MTAVSDGTNLVGLYFDGQHNIPHHIDDRSLEAGTLSVFRQTAAWLDTDFKGEQPQFTPKIRLQATPFRMRVWRILQSIPYGETLTYQNIAQEVSRQTGQARMSAQAVGGAVAHNPICIIIPCHRVVGKDGSLTGYAGGLDRKAGLLALEGQQHPSSAQ